MNLTEFLDSGLHHYAYRVSTKTLIGRSKNIQEEFSY